MVALSPSVSLITGPTVRTPGVWVLPLTSARETWVRPVSMAHQRRGDGLQRRGDRPLTANACAPSGRPAVPPSPTSTACWRAE